jgi:hypothetical protein
LLTCSYPFVILHYALCVSVAIFHARYGIISVHNTAIMFYHIIESFSTLINQ